MAWGSDSDPIVPPARFPPTNPTKKPPPVMESAHPSTLVCPEIDDDGKRLLLKNSRLRDRRYLRARRQMWVRLWEMNFVEFPAMQGCPNTKVYNAEVVFANSGSGADRDTNDGAGAK